MSKRMTQQLCIAVIGGMLTVVLFFFVDSKYVPFRWSMATAYAGLVFIGLSLIIGPLHVLRGLPNPVSTSLRRDVGICGGLLGLIHTVVGLQVHMSGRFWLYFLYPREENHLIPFRYDFFGLANYTGLAMSLVLVLLLSLSSDAALTRLGARRWKWWQRWNYAGFALLIVHAIAYQYLEKRTAGFILALALAIVLVGMAQVLGARKVGRTAKEIRPSIADSEGGQSRRAVDETRLQTK